MSNRTDRANDEKTIVAYSYETDPDKVSRDEVYEAKRSIFGGDDGVISVELETIKNWVQNSKSKTDLRVKLTPRKIAFLLT